jgi:hypothetical protein
MRVLAVLKTRDLIIYRFELTEPIPALFIPRKRMIQACWGKPSAAEMTLGFETFEFKPKERVWCGKNQQFLFVVYRCDEFDKISANLL